LGPTGNKIFMATQYDGTSGSTIVVRNLGTLDQWLKIGVSGGTSLQVADPFGNVENVPVQNGEAIVSARSCHTTCY
jgi:hypothetical protein